MNIDAFVKRKLTAADDTMVSTYRHSITGKEFQMVHPTAEHKRRVDAKHKRNGTFVREGK